MKKLVLGIVVFIFFGCQNTSEKKGQSLADLKGNADLLYEKEKYAEAAEAYAHLLKIDSMDGQFYYRRAYSLCQIDKHEDSIHDYLKSAELGFREFDSYFAAGLLYATLLNDDSLAIQYLERCIQIDPNSEKVKRLIKKISEERKS